MKKNPFFVFLGFTLIFTIQSCKEELPPQSIDYRSTKFGSGIYIAGNSGFPTVDWGSEEGMFLLRGVYQDISIHAITGEISWTNTLPLGDTKIQVIAQNSFGQVSVDLTITSVMAGKFLGAFNTDPNSTVLDQTGLEMDFLSDGTFKARYNTFLSSDGSYTLSADNTTISGTFTMPGTTTLYSFEGIISYTATQKPSITGYLKQGTSTTWSGYFKVDMQ
ncbi:MAG: hypothetical protein OEX02_00625 [Cyclobacteriaceae bacterium]|nr:hypothetical protein [Cyclobacteriaceae bacterium]